MNIFSCITLGIMCLQSMTSTVPGKLDWNLYDQSSNDILLVRWIDASTTLNVEGFADGTTACWLFDGNGMINCPE